MSGKDGSRISDAFTSSLSKAYSTHVCEVNALQHEVQRLSAMNKQREEIIMKLKTNIERMKDALRSARVKIQEEVSVQKRLRIDIQRHHFSLPCNICDITPISDEENFLVDNTPAAPVGNREQRSNAEKHACVCISSSTYSTCCGDHLKRGKCNRSPVHSAEILVPTSPLNTVKEHSQIKSKDISINISECTPEAMEPKYSLSQSTSESPSLLHAPGSLQMEECFEENMYGVEQMEKSPKEQRSPIMPFNDSQFSLKFSHSIPESYELPQVPSAWITHEPERQHSTEHFPFCSCSYFEKISDDTIQFLSQPSVRILSNETPANKPLFNNCRVAQHLGSALIKTTSETECKQCESTQSEDALFQKDSECNSHSQCVTNNDCLPYSTCVEGRSVAESCRRHDCKTKRHKCQHQKPHPRQDTDPRMWNISFPESDTLQ